MKVLRLILGVFIGLVVITLVAESIEFVTVKIISGIKFSELTTNENGYFEVRNTPGILFYKAIYLFLAGPIGGFLTR